MRSPVPAPEPTEPSRGLPWWTRPPIALGLLGLLAVLSILIAWSAYAWHARERRAEVEAGLLAIAQHKQTLIEDHFRERLANAAVVANTLRVQQALLGNPGSAGRQRELAAARKALLATEASYRYRRILVFDRKLESTLPHADPRLRPEVAAGVAEVIRSGKPALVDAFGSDEMRYAVAHPVRSPLDDTIIGAVYLEAEAASLLLPTLLDWTGPEATGESVLLRADGDERILLLVRGHRSEAGPVRRLVRARTPSLLAARVLAGASGLIDDGLDYSDTPVLAAVGALPGTPWFLINKVDLEEIHQGDRTLAAIFGGLTVLSVLLCGLLLRLAWRNAQDRITLQQARQEQRYADTVESSRDAFLHVDAQGTILAVNEAAVTLTGHSREELVGMNVHALDAQFSTTDFERLVSGIKAGTVSRFQSMWRRRDDRIIDVDVSAVFISETEGANNFVRDITESMADARRLQRLNELHVFMNSLTEPLVRQRDPQALLDAVCRAAVERGHFLLAWAGTADADGRTIRPTVAHGLAADYARGIEVSMNPDDPHGKGPSGRAWREQHPVIVNDFLGESSTTPWQARARALGIRASAVVPVLVEGRTVATLNFYSGVVGYFDEGLIALLVETARNVSLAWEAGEASRQRDREQELRQRMQARYQRILEASPAPIQIHALADGRLTAINRAHEQTFGYPLEDIAGERWFERVYEDPQFRSEIRSAWLADAERARATDTVIHSPELQLRCRDGSKRIVVGAMTVSGEDAVVAWTDLTLIRAQEAALRHSEQRFMATFEQAAVGIALVNPQGRFLNVNRRLCDILGYTREELLARTFHDVTYVEDINVGPPMLQRLISGELDTFQVEKRYRHKDGHIVWVNLTVALARTPQGEPDYFISVLEDIGERKRAEAALRESEGRFRGMVEQTVACMYVVRDNRFVYVNPEFERVLGWTRAELLGHDPVEFLHPVSLQSLQEGRASLTSTGEARASATWRCKDGRQVILGIHAVAGQWEGSPATIVMAEDITERTRNEERQAHQARLSAALLELPRLAETLPEKAFLQRAQELAEDLTGSQIAFIHFVHPDAESIELVAWSRRTLEHYCHAAYDRHYPVSQAGIWADALRQQRPVLFNDYASYPHKRGLPEGHSPLQRLISVPVFEDSRVVMLTGVGNKPGDYTERDVETVQLLSNATWRLAKSRRDTAELAASEQRFRNLVEQAATGFFAVSEHRIIYANRRMAEIMGTTPDGMLGRDPASFVAPESLAAVRQVQADIDAGRNSVSMQVQARRTDGTPIVLGLNGVRGRWNDNTAIIYVAGDITERARAADQAAAYLQRLEKSLKSTLEAVARMVDLRDPYTAGHERRVGLIAADIAREMGWSEARCASLELIGLVHDIGKIAVPAELLAKPTRLTAIEYEMIKVHAQAGYDILKDVPFEQPVAEIIRQHHERMDGSGYPQGLKGPEILPEARVLAVADVLESMATHRPYRPALGVDAALEEIGRNSGRLYDPEVVAAVHRLVREKGYTLPI